MSGKCNESTRYRKTDKRAPVSTKHRMPRGYPRVKSEMERAAKARPKKK